MAGASICEERTSRKCFDLQISRLIFQEKGFFRGFYAGALPNFTRCVLRNAMRYPLYTQLPLKFAQTLPEQLRSKPHFQKLATSFTIAALEALILTPIERTKTYRMTQKTHVSYYQFYHKIRANFWVEIYRGLTPIFLKNAFTLTVLLQSDHFVKLKLRQKFGIKKEEQIPLKLLLPGSLLVALVNSAIVMPFEVVKTQLEKERSAVSIRRSFDSIYQSGRGTQALFTGFRLRLLLTLSNATLTAILLEVL